MSAPQDEPVANSSKGVFIGPAFMPNEMPEYFAKKGIVEGLTYHPLALVRQMANEILRMRSLDLSRSSPSAIRAATVAECSIAGRGLRRWDSHGTDEFAQGWNAALEQFELSIRALSPRPQISEAWIGEQAAKPGYTNYDIIRAAFVARGYEIGE